MYTPYPTRQYEKAFRKLKHSGRFDESRLNKVINTLACGERLHPIHKDHALHGEYESYRECHIHGDMLLIYRVEKQKLVLMLIDIGSHSELF